MNTDQIIALLVAERDRLNRAIEALQGPVAVKRRGRPPKSASAVVAAAPAPAASASVPKKGRRGFTAAERKAQSEKLKAYWKKRKAAEAKE
jgi:hypothetical protein